MLSYTFFIKFFYRKILVTDFEESDQSILTFIYLKKKKIPQIDRIILNEEQNSASQLQNFGKQKIAWA